MRVPPRSSIPQLLGFTMLVSAACAGADGPVVDEAATLEDMIAAVPRARLVEELRLDANAEDFSVVLRLFVGPDGRIVVPLLQDQQVRIYDAAGSLMAAVGRRGGGPGEFQGISSMGFAGDTLWIYDARLRRVTRVAPDGTLLRTEPTPADIPLDDPGAGGPVGNIVIFTPVAVHGDGAMLGDARYRTTRDGNQAISATTVTLARPDGDASVVHTPAPFEDPRWMLEVAGFGRPVPFTMRPQTAASTDGLRLATLHTETLSGDGGVLSFALFRWPESLGAGAAGGEARTAEPVFTRSYAFRGEPIPRSAIDSVLASFIPESGRPTEGPADLPQRFQALARERMPSIYTPVAALRLGLDDTIWLDLRPTADGRASLILDGRGNPVATVAVPSNVIIRQSSATHIWATERDEDGLNSVVRYRLEGF